jgi:hypothetical protein
MMPPLRPASTVVVHTTPQGFIPFGSGRLLLSQHKSHSKCTGINWYIQEEEEDDHQLYFFGWSSLVFCSWEPMDGADEFL